VRQEYQEYHCVQGALDSAMTSVSRKQYETHFSKNW
jgi:hypothetical protein